MSVLPMEVDVCKLLSVEKLNTNNFEECEEALVDLKNTVIGSNRLKAYVISQGVVPKLIDMIVDDANIPQHIRIDALIVLGSLAKGSSEEVRLLIFDYNLAQILLSQLESVNNCKQIIEYCLVILKSIFHYPFAPMELLHANIGTLSHLINLASIESNVQIQVCVTNILVPLCHTYNDQMQMCQAGTIPFLSRMMSSQLQILQIPALKCMASMCFTNRAVSDIVCVTSFEGKSLPEILTTLLSRTNDSEVQLAAARCLTYIHRSGTLPSTDNRIVFKTMPCLARLCTDEFCDHIRASSAETLAYLAEVDSQLQRVAAISNHLIMSLAQLLRTSNTLSKQGAFRCFASLGANDENIRKRIIEMKGLMEKVVEGLGDTNSEVRLAAVRCLHSLSRSVQQLRTSFQDHSVWKPLMSLLAGQPTNELLTVVTSTICNLLLEFSPAKEPMLDSGVVEMLCVLTENPDPALRLNGSWALMNMAFQAEQHVKNKIVQCLRTDRILNLLSDNDTRVIMKTLGLLRNLLSKSFHIDIIMSEHWSDIMKAVNMVLDSPNSPEVKEQALCIIGNIAAGSKARDYIMEDENILKHLENFLTQKDAKLQAGALFVIGNLTHKIDSKSDERYAKLQSFNITAKLQELQSKTSKDSDLYDEILKIIKHLKYS